MLVWVLVEKDGVNIAAHEMELDLRDWKITQRICQIKGDCHG